MKRLFVLFFFILMWGTAVCQHSSNSYNKLGDSLYAQHHFLYAAKYYEKALKNAPDPGSIMIKLARSYGKLNGTSEAARWYSQARSNRASFTNEDIYQYAQVLSMEEKRGDAEAVLRELVEEDAYARKEREFLEDLANYEKYYKDSTSYIVKSLPFNTPVSEFAPAFYKDGIVYTSATPENIVKPKYHWDNSHFLNLLYSKVVEYKFQKPSFFERDLNTKYHDGPVVFYNNFNSMIVNRNQKGVSDTHGDVWHVALLEAQYVPAKDSWQLTPLPFDEAPYSFLHPNISEDGNTLYFVSNKPGGYGGTDIYRSVRTNGTWSKPFNLGPTVNSSDNEVFPFYDGTTLYFASRGHGGLGGLDIYKSTLTVNGFTPPENLGFPINSAKDDFSFIVSKDQRTGYFSSSRSGNDDLFSFEKNYAKVPLMVHTFDGTTREPLDGAAVSVISAVTDDLALRADSSGNFSFSLPENTDYIIVVSKADKIGMHMGISNSATDKGVTHQLPAYSDTTTTPCVGLVKDKNGVAANAKNITVFDETSNKEIARLEDSDMINFPGEKNHQYRIEIRNANGDTTVQKIQVEPAGTLPKTWTMVLADEVKPVTMAARIFNADNDQPLANARVEIITFSESNLELYADADGRVDFTLPAGTTFLLIGSNAQYSGMLSGVAEKGQDKTSMVHPVPAFGDKDTLDTKFLMALVTDEKGDIVKDATITVKDKISGDSIPVNVSDGLLYFKGKVGKSYTVALDHDDFNPFGEEVTVTERTGNVEKISFVLKRDSESKPLQFALHVFKDSDKTNLPGASVTIISSSDADLELVADDNGVAEFSLAEGTAYMAIARKDDLVGNFLGTAEKEFSKEFMVNPLPAFSEATSQSPVVAKLVDSKGDLIPTANATVLKSSSGEKISTKQNGGLISFAGESGEEYTITVEDKTYGTITRNLTVGEPEESGIVQLDLLMQKPTPRKSDYVMDVQVVKASDHSPLSGAKVVVISFSEPDQEFVANDEGRTSFSIGEGNDYMIVGSSEGYAGMLAGTAEKGNENSNTIHIIEAFADDKKDLPVVAQLIDHDGDEIQVADVSVRENSTQKAIDAKFDRGIVTFAGEKGKQYTILVERDGNATSHIHTVTDRPGSIDKLSIILPQESHDLRESDINARAAATFNKNLIVFQTEAGESKVYFTDHNSFGEVIEDEGKLQLVRGDSTIILGRGRLANISSETDILRELRLTESEIVSLKNIYFDFNKAQLDAKAKTELEKVNYVLSNFPSLQLVIRAHADDRGQDSYNMMLSKRRAKAVGSYLLRRGIAKNRIIQNAMGETRPEVVCPAGECSEEEHQRNRRAEFALRGENQLSSPKVSMTRVSATSKNSFARTNRTLTYQEILAKYGDNRVPHLTFKIALGVYRYNNSLTFDELKDLGKVETIKIDGTTYYYLSEYFTIREAEGVKKRVVERGVKDAYITFYYHNKNVKFQEVKQLLQSTPSVASEESVAVKSK